MKQVATLLTAAAILAAGATGAPAQAASTDTAAGLAEWAKIHAVFSHPRCANCHVEDNRPRWSGSHYGATRVHGFNVQGGPDGSGKGNPGLRCQTCHFESNSNILHGPPGAHNWHLPPAGMVWWQKSSAQICAQIKDKSRNGDRSLEQVAEHVKTDKLVAWGWSPGLGREPAPGSAEETYQALLRWTELGAPCPSE